MAELELNFQFSANAQTLGASSGSIVTMGDNFARMITEEVALAASAGSFEQARRRFITSVKMVIRSEVSRMAMLIGRFLPLPDKYTGPHGEMSMGERSTTAKNFGFPTDFNRKSTNIDWQARSPKYLDWKKHHGKPAKWWANDGGLQKDLMSKGGKFYEEIFGPIRVRFERPKAGRDARGRFARMNPISGKAMNPNTPERGIIQGRTNVTGVGGRGRISSEFQVGTLHVDLFGKITPAMLPGLANMDPQKADPYPGDGLAGLFPEGETQMKLLWKGAGKGKATKHHRYAIEPFVSFYLMRAIPNAVWRRTEALVLSSVTGAGNATGLGNQFGASNFSGS